MKTARVPDRLIVKFRTEGANRVALPPAVLGRRAGPQQPPPDDQALGRYQSLFRLNDESKLRSIEPLLPRPDMAPNRPLPERASSEPKVAQDVNAKYPKRARRAAGTSGPPSELSSYFILEFEPGGDLEEIRRRYQASPFVELVEFDRLLPLHLAPDDPFFSSTGAWGQAEDDLWGLKRLHLGAAWDITQGEGILVAVLDSGLDYEHRDITANVWTNPGEEPGNGRDDDGNGFVDDVRGWDFWDDDADPKDENGHGTHVAGTIAAVGNNMEGVIGVAPKARVMTLKGGGAGREVSLVAMARAFLYAISNGADVANCSWGPNAGDGSFSPLLEEVIRLARRVGMVVVFSSGNDGQFMTHASPTSMREVLAVGASTPTDEPTAFSNSGPRVGLVAPGGGRPDAPDSGQDNILSLKAGVIGEGHPLRPLVVREHYLRLAGTSMAAPHVSGAAALVLAKRPDFTVDDVIAALYASCDDVGDPGFDLRTGFGRLNVAAALAVERPLRVRITAPDDKSTLPMGGGPIAVTGSVAGPDLREWRLVYAPLLDLSRVETIAGPESAPREGTLASWDAGALALQPYLLRLIATDRDGRTYEDAVAVGVPGRPGTVLNRGDRATRVADLSGERVVWLEGKRVGIHFEESTIELIDLVAGQRRRVAELAPGYATRLALDGEWLAHDLFEPGPDGPTGPPSVSMVLRNLSTGSVETLGRLPRDLPFPFPQVALGGGRVFWTDEDDAVQVRELTEGAKPRPLGPTAFRDLQAHGDHLVWGDDVDIFAMQLPDGEPRQLTQDGLGEGLSKTGFFNRRPHVQDGQVAWLRRNGELSPTATVMAFDLISGRSQVIRRDVLLPRDLAVGSRRVFWDDGRAAQHDVAVGALEIPRVDALTGELDNQFVLAAEGSRVVLARRRRAQVGGEDAAVYDLVLVDAATPAAFRGGVHRQDGVEYVSNISPDGRAATLIFSNFLCEVDPGGSTLVAKQQLSVALPFRDTQDSTSARIILRGHGTDLRAGSGATLLVVAGGKPTAFELGGSTGPFQREVTVPVPAGTELTLSLYLALERPAPAGAGGVVQLESADIELTTGP